MKTLQIIVSGKVQGVFFRKETQKLAQKLMISGTVMNLDDGNVEIICPRIRRIIKTASRMVQKGPKIGKSRTSMVEMDRC